MLSALTAPPKPTHGTPCSVGVLLSALRGKEKNALEKMLTPGSGWSHTAIWEACIAERYQVAEQTVGRHRNGKCRCFK